MFLCYLETLPLLNCKIITQHKNTLLFDFNGKKYVSKIKGGVTNKYYLSKVISIDEKNRAENIHSFYDMLSTRLSGEDEAAHQIRKGYRVETGGKLLIVILSILIIYNFLPFLL